MADKNNFTTLNDQELVVKIKEDSRYLSVVEKRFKSSCIRFVRWKLKRNISDVDLEEMFQDACLALYENIIKDKYTHTNTLQSYMNTVCRNNMMNRLNRDSKKERNELKADNFETDYYNELPENIDYNDLITDSLDSIKKLMKMNLITLRKH